MDPLRAAGAMLAVCVSVAALAFAWGQVHRTTAVATQGWPVLFRSNLLTGKVEACVVVEARVRCLPQAPDFSADSFDPARPHTVAPGQG